MTTKYQLREKVIASALVLILSSNSAGFYADADSKETRVESHESFIRPAAPLASLNVPSLDVPSDLEGGGLLNEPVIAATGAFAPPAEAVLNAPAANILMQKLPANPEPHRPRPRLSSTLKRMAAAVRGFSLQTLYDTDNKGTDSDLPLTFAQGIIHEDPKPLALHWGVEKVAPALRAPKDVIARRHFHPTQISASREAGIVLDADPDDAEDVERTIRALLKSQPKKFGLTDDEGNPVLDPDDLALVHIMPVKGGLNRADTIHAVFRQVHKGIREDGRPYYLQVYDASLSLTFKVLAGKPILAGYTGRLYPVKVDMTPKISNDILQSVAEQRLMPATAPGRVFGKFRNVLSKPLKMTSRLRARKPEFLTRGIIPDDKGNWHAANIYQGADLNGRPVNIAVDIATGEVFAWDARGHILHSKRPASARPAAVEVHLVQPPAPGADASATSVTILGRGNTMPHGDDHGPIDAMPMPHLKIRDPQGNFLGATDEEGRLILPSGQTLEVTAGLEGDYAAVDDADEKNSPLKIVMKLTPGYQNRAVLNPTSDDAELTGQIDSYLGWNLLLRWMKSLGVNDERVNLPLTIHNNKADMPCNAYYDPLSDTLNLERESPDCENSAQPSILLHESGHRFVNFFARIDEGYMQAMSERFGLPGGAFEHLRQSLDSIMGRGVNEGTADTLSMYFRDNPKIGENFFKHPGPDRPLVLRDGRNRKQYQPGEAHDEGEALMGATWEIYEKLKAMLGDDAGAAYASAMVVPTLIFSQPMGVEDAIAQILLASMHKNGDAPHAAVVRQAAQDHGIPLS